MNENYIATTLIDIFFNKKNYLLSLVAQRFIPNLRAPATRTYLKLKLHHASCDKLTLHLPGSEKQNDGASYPEVLDIHVRSYPVFEK